MFLRSWILAIIVAATSASAADQVAGASAPAPTAADQVLDFNATVKMAIERSPSLSTARSDLEIRDLEYKNAYSVILPSLDLSTTAGYLDSRPKLTDHLWSSEFNLALTENLYDNGVSLTNLNSSKVRREIADLNFRSERDQLLLDVATEYMRYSLAKTLYETQRQQFDVVSRQYRSVESQFQQGVRTRRDYLKFKTEVRRNEIDVERAHTAVESSRVELMRLLGFDQRQVTPFDFVPIEVNVAALEKVPSLAPDISGHYQYRLAELEKHVLENDVQIVRRRDWPELSLTAGANYHRGDYLGVEIAPVQSDVTSWNALVSLKFNLWDWGIRRRNISIAEAKRTQAQNTLAIRLNTFSSDNSKLMLDLQQSSKNFAIARELLELETKSFDFMNTDYRNGKVSYLDIVLGLRDLLNAQVQMNSTYFELRQQLLKYRFYEGRLYESLFEK
jgi:outer membrane protein TolC